MKLSFHGAARNVTGSKHLLSLDNRTRILLDCGMFQGMGLKTDELNSEFGFNPSEISFLLLSHAHIDHSGLIPKLVKEGFRGKICCTPATKDLTEILLYDSAEIQTYEIDIINKRRSGKNLPPYEPLYTSEDVTETMKYFETVEFDEIFDLTNKIKVLFTNTGHLIGSAAIHLTIKENRKETKISYSGDVGRYRSILLQPPAEFPQADYLILESTYGDRQHEMVFNNVDPLLQWIKKTCMEKKGKLIIPAFSVGRTQEVLYALNQLDLENRLPEINFFVDSPLSLKATSVIKKYTGHFNERLQAVLKIDEDPFAFSKLKYIETVEDSKQLVNYDEPCVIISASGTADAGRVRHHIFNCIGNDNHTILLVGYCGEESLGGQLLQGVKEVELMGDPCNVIAEVGAMRSMSAHGDMDDLCQYISCQDPEKLKKVFLVHGEYEVQKKFVGRLERKGINKVEIPFRHQVYEL